MTAKQENINYDKNILIFGKSEEERHLFLEKILLFSNLETVKFPKGIENISDYIDTIRKKKLFTPNNELNPKYNSNQLLDFHIDWIAENKCLLIFEEFQKMEKKWKLEILRILLENFEKNKKSASKFIITIDDENGIIDEILKIINATKFKTQNQIIESNLEIIEI